jgi:hypothetical protein
MKINKLNALYFLILLGLVSCSKKEIVKPNSILDAKTMTSVLAEVHFAEATIQIFNLNSTDSSKKIGYQYYKNIFDKNKTDVVTFKKSFDWYKERPELFTVIYDSVLTKISENQANATKK